MAAPFTGKVLLEGGMGTFFDRRVQLDQLKSDISCYSLARAWMQNSANSLAGEVPDSAPESWSADTFCRLKLPQPSTEPLNYREALQKPASLALMLDLPPRGGAGEDACDIRASKRARHERRASAKASETDSDADLIDGSSEAADDVLRGAADTGSVVSDVATAADGASETDDARSFAGEGVAQDDDVAEGLAAEAVAAAVVADAARRGAEDAPTLKERAPCDAKDEAVGETAAEAREHHATPRSPVPSAAQGPSVASSPLAAAASPSRALTPHAALTPKLETAAEASTLNSSGTARSATDRSAMNTDVAGRAASKRTRAASGGSSTGGSAACSTCCSGSSVGRSLGSVSDSVRGSGMGSGGSASAPRPPAPHKQSSSDSSARSAPGDGQLKLALCAQRRAAVPKLLQQHLERFQCVRQFARAQSVCRLRRVRKRIALLIGLARAEKAQGSS